MEKEERSSPPLPTESILNYQDYSVIGRATSDPFVQVRVGLGMLRTSTVSKTTDPVWPEDGSLSNGKGACLTGREPV